MSGASPEMTRTSNPFHTLYLMYIYALAFHLGLPWLSYLMIGIPKEITLAQDWVSGRWDLWPAGSPSQSYILGLLVAFVAVIGALFLPKKLMKSNSLSDNAASQKNPSGSGAVSYVARMILLEFVSLCGFVVSFLEAKPGLAVPFALVGFCFTVVFPPSKFRLVHGLAGVTSLLGALFVIGACVTIPETGRSQLVAIPDGYMNQMGEKAYSELKTKEKVSLSGAVNTSVIAIGERIARASDKKFDWEFTVFESKEVNAFCLPGGKVGVYTGILPVAQNNAGLAAIMGHEVAHAVARHGAERATQSLIVSGTLLSLEKVIENPKYRQLAMGALGLGVQFGVMLPFSRAHESEADAMGLVYMAKAGYDPREAVKLWERMGAQSSRPPEWLSTHPDPIRRARDLEKQMSKALTIYEASEKVSTKTIL